MFICPWLAQVSLFQLSWSLERQYFFCAKELKVSASFTCNSLTYKHVQKLFGVFKQTFSEIILHFSHRISDPFLYMYSFQKGLCPLNTVQEKLFIKHTQANQNNEIKSSQMAGHDYMKYNN